MGRFGAIHRRARDRHTIFHDFEFYNFQAKNGKDSAQEAQTRPRGEPGGKSGAYSAD
jgi:hypothetical protein